MIKVVKVIVCMAVLLFQVAPAVSMACPGMTADEPLENCCCSEPVEPACCDEEENTAAASDTTCECTAPTEAAATRENTATVPRTHEDVIQLFINTAAPQTAAIDIDRATVLADASPPPSHGPAIFITHCAILR